jgi:hypothetical protein
MFQNCARQSEPSPGVLDDRDSRGQRVGFHYFRAGSADEMWLRMGDTPTPGFAGQGHKIPPISTLSVTPRR